jgi:transcriptional regulator with XRE-family HTH domain
MLKILNCDIFSENIKRIRTSCGLTQAETVAKLQLLGSPLSRSTYSLIETGRGNIFVSDLVGLQKVFGVDYSEFFKDISISRPSKNCD